MYHHYHFLNFSHVLMVPLVKLVREHVCNALLVTAVTMEHLVTCLPLARLDSTV